MVELETGLARLRDLKDERADLHPVADADALLVEAFRDEVLAEAARPEEMRALGKLLRP